MSDGTDRQSGPAPFRVRRAGGKPGKVTSTNPNFQELLDEYYGDVGGDTEEASGKGSRRPRLKPGSVAPPRYLDPAARRATDEVHGIIEGQAEERPSE